MPVVEAFVAELVGDQMCRLRVAPEDPFERAVGQRGMEVLEHLDRVDEQDRVTTEAGGVRDWLGDPGLAQTGPADADDVAVLVDEAAVEQFLDDAGFELRTSGKVEPVESFDRAQVRTLQSARKLALLSYVPLSTQQQDGEVRVGQSIALGTLEEFGPGLRQRRQVQVDSEAVELAIRLARCGDRGLTLHHDPPCRCAWVER